MDMGMEGQGMGVNSNYLYKNHLKSWLTAGFFLLLCSYHDAMNDTFIKGLGIFFTLYLEIVTETTHAGNNVTYCVLASYLLVCWRGIP